MERLTEHHYNKTMGAYMVCSGACIDDDFDCNNCKKLAEIIDRLAAYEDTGLEPEEAMELAQARKPHKGYKIEGFYCPICAKRHDRIVEIDGVYFTRAEAEAALERRKGEQNG